jgi:hypothetical protein
MPGAKGLALGGQHHHTRLLVLATASSADCRATSISLLKALKRCASLSVMRATPRSSWLSCTKESLIAVSLLSD